MYKKLIIIIVIITVGLVYLNLNSPAFSQEPSASTTPDDPPGGEIIDDDDDDDDDDENITPSPTAPISSPSFFRQKTDSPVLKDFSLTAPKLFRKSN